MLTTLNAIRSHNPCTEGWKKLLAHLGKTKADDEPLSILTILDSNGLDDALWCLRAVEGHDREVGLYVVWCARQVQHMMDDPRSVAALDVAERYANGAATRDELVTAREAARDAAWDAARAALDAARDAKAARAAEAARDAAEASRRAARDAAGAAEATWAAWAAARDAEAARSVEAARDAAWDAARAAEAAWAAWAARDAKAAWAVARAAEAARDAAGDAAEAAQERRLREICMQEVSA